MFRRRPQEQIQPEWLIVGLGNPGGEYRGTRHNVGFDVIERLANRHKIRLDRSKHQALTGLGRIDGTPVFLAKPLKYMNNSGQSVAPLARSFGLKPNRILIVADDLDLALGKLRLKEKGSAGGHNGHKSIISALHSDEYPRFKIGIGDADRPNVINHVLSGFSPDERAIVEPTLQATVEAIEVLLSRGVEAAQLRVAERNKQLKDGEID